jgi:formamidopyrimidine-DNA glycosylase
VPELPEVETVRSGLDKHVVGRTIDTVEVLHPRAVRRHLAGPADFEAVLRGQTFTGARRRGKYLWLPVADDALLAHLGMSGQLLVGDPERPVSGSPSPTRVLTCVSPTSGRSATWSGPAVARNCRR